MANLTTGAIINSDLVSYSAGGNVEPFGIAVDPATDTLYWTTVNFSADSGNAIYSAKYTTGASVTLSDTQTLATTSQAQAPIGIALDVPAGGYYVDTSTGVSNDTTANEVLFGSSLTSPETLTDVYNVPDQDGGTETLPTEAIVVEVQPVVAASGTVTFVNGGAAVAIDSGATVSDADGYYLASATVSIASGFQTGDVLAFDGSFTPRRSPTAIRSRQLQRWHADADRHRDAANYQAALDSVTFSTTSTGTTARTIDWTVSDGVVSSATDDQHGGRSRCHPQSPPGRPPPSTAAAAPLLCSYGLTSIHLDAGERDGEYRQPTYRRHAELHQHQLFDRRQHRSQQRCQRPTGVEFVRGYGDAD